jgi:hypothetical protein
MSAYVLGAVPPYSMLLGGKLVACLVRSRKIRDDFARKYGESFGMILEKRRASALVLVTVTSALGRSSVYNRLSLNGARYFRSLGFTGGWGHFHIPSDLFELIRDYLEARGDEYGHNNRFGEGPNWRLRATRRALELMGLDPGLLRHGIRREVFACELASNAKEYLRGEDETPDYRGLLSVPKVGELARKRWMEKRAESHSDYLAWRKESYLKLIEPSGSRDGRRRHVPREF